MEHPQRQHRKPIVQLPPEARAAWNIPEWCRELRLGRSTFYTLSIRPRYIKVGKRLIVIESPADYAARIAKLQGETK